MKFDAYTYVNEHIISEDLSYRGGCIKVDVSELFPYIDDAVVGAYQNYLGGGLVGSIQGASKFYPEELKTKDKKKFTDLLEACKKYVYYYTNHDYDEWEGASFDATQARPVSAY